MGIKIAKIAWVYLICWASVGILPNRHVLKPCELSKPSFSGGERVRSQTLLNPTTLVAGKHYLVPHKVGDGGDLWCPFPRILC